MSFEIVQFEQAEIVRVQNAAAKRPELDVSCEPGCEGGGIFGPRRIRFKRRDWGRGRMPPLGSAIVPDLVAQDSEQVGTMPLLEAPEDPCFARSLPEHAQGALQQIFGVLGRRDSLRANPPEYVRPVTLDLGNGSGQFSCDHHLVLVTGSNPGSNVNMSGASAR